MAVLGIAIISSTIVLNGNAQCCRGNCQCAKGFLGDFVVLAVYSAPVDVIGVGAAADGGLCTCGCDCDLPLIGRDKAGNSRFVFC